MENKLIVILISFLVFFSKNSFYAYAESSNNQSANKIKELTHPKRIIYSQPTRVTKTLKIKPGMNILDVGAGTGNFTFLFAEALKGTGNVFATEVNPHMLNYIKDKMQKNRNKNILPVLVKPIGLDPFYKEHSFDIIFMSGVYHRLWPLKDYFRELRPSLKKNGRLYILADKNDYGFIECMFDFKRLIEILISKGEDFPVFKRLSEQVQHFIKDWQGSVIPDGIKVRIDHDFNKMLSDKTLFNDLLAYYYSKENLKVGNAPKVLDSVDIQLVKWLAIRLDENGVFDGEENIAEIDKKQLHKLNRILLIAIFQIDKFFPDNENNGIVVEKNSIIRTLEVAGYRFVREYDFVPMFHFLEFEGG